MSSVKVAVRVRPFNTREIERGARCIIEMQGKSTRIIDPETLNKEKPAFKDFTYDYSYNSFVDRNDPAYASQQVVFRDLGVQVLENAWEGYNCSLFAYGQTGSGKSYSMLGYGEDKGIIPLACEEMFRRINSNADDSVQFTVEVSFMEIYNETVKDLLDSKRNTSKAGLKVRNHPKTGPYVEDLSKWAVTSFQQINQIMDEGSKARTVASTNMNNTSSRSHAVFTIVFTQTKIDRASGRASDKVSKINLVDLAGSERANSTGATGATLKEGANINKSLSTLGKVISALAEKSGGKKNVFIPYRDSVLTWLLKESLGGNAKTIMIAAISPADINYEETLSTLRYAERAKKIKNQAIINEDPNLKLIRELRAEIEFLRKQLTLAGVKVPDSQLPRSDEEEGGHGGADNGEIEHPAEGDGVSSAPSSPRGEGEQPETTRDVDNTANGLEEVEDLSQLDVPLDDEDGRAGVGSGDGKVVVRKLQVADLKRKLLQSEKLIAELSVTWEEKLRATAARQAETARSLAEMGIAIKVDTQIPSLVNLNEDPLMSECLVYYLPEGETRIGRSDAERPQTIILNGIAIAREHCVIEHTAGEVTLIPLAGAVTFVNGKRVEAPTPLHHGYRVILGNNHVFRFNSPLEKRKQIEAAAAPPTAAAESDEASAAVTADGTHAAEAESTESTPATAGIIDWDFAMSELSAVQTGLRELEGFQEAAQREEEEQRVAMEARLRDLEQQIAREREEAERRIAAQRAEYEERLKEKEGAAAGIQQQQHAEDDKNREHELKLQRAKLLRISERLLASRRRRAQLEGQIRKALLLVNEANILADTLQRGGDIKFDLKLHVNPWSVSGKNREELLGFDQTELRVRVSSAVDNSTLAMWSLDDFEARLIRMREKYMDVIAGGTAAAAVSADDPFDLSTDDELIGLAHLSLKPLTYLISTAEALPVFNYYGIQVGVLHIRVRPRLVDAVDSAAAEPVDDDDRPVEDPAALVGKRLELSVEISRADELDKQYRNVYVAFAFFADQAVAERGTVSFVSAKEGERSEMATYRTDRCPATAVNPAFNYRHVFVVDEVSEALIDYCNSRPLVFEVRVSHDVDKASPETALSETVTTPARPATPPQLATTSPTDVATPSGLTASLAAAALPSTPRGAVGAATGEISPLTSSFVRHSPFYADREKLAAAAPTRNAASAAPGVDTPSTVAASTATTAPSEFSFLLRVEILENSENDRFDPVPTKDQPWRTPAVCFKLRLLRRRQVVISLSGTSEAGLQFVNCSQLFFTDVRLEGGDNPAADDSHVDSSAATAASPSGVRIPLEVVSCSGDKIVARWEHSLQTVTAVPLLARVTAKGQRLLLTLVAEVTLSTLSHKAVTLSKELTAKIYDKEAVFETPQEILPQYRELLAKRHGGKPPTASPTGAMLFSVSVKRERRRGPLLKTAEDAAEQTVAMIEEHRADVVQLSSTLEAELSRQETVLREKLDKKNIRTPTKSPMAATAMSPEADRGEAESPVWSPTALDSAKSRSARRRTGTVIEVKIKDVLSRDGAEKVGFLNKRGARRTSAVDGSGATMMVPWKRFWFVLRRPYLYYYGSPADQQEKGVIDLAGCMISPGEENPSHPYTFAIISWKKVWVLETSSAAERDEWMWTLDPSLKPTPQPQIAATPPPATATNSTPQPATDTSQTPPPPSPTPIVRQLATNTPPPPPVQQGFRSGGRLPMTNYSVVSKSVNDEEEDASAPLLGRGRGSPPPKNDEEGGCCKCVVS